MSRMQKKCLIASFAAHGLMVVVLVVGPAFFVSEDKPDSHQIISVISGRVVDDALTSGGSQQPQPVQPPPPAPAVVTPPQPPKVEPIKIPDPPKPAQLPVKEPDVKLVKNPTPLNPDDFKIVKRSPVKPTPTKPADPNARQIAENQALLRRLNNAASHLSTSLAKDTAVQINAGADNGEPVTNYRDIVASMYTAAWTPPVSLEDDSATVIVRVTIARDGRVTAHQITKPSGNASMDKSIENTLENVTFIEPFPEGSKDLERTFSIKFNLAAKRSLG